MNKELESLLERQRQLFAALLALVRKQRDAIRADISEEHLAALLADRGRLLQQSSTVDDRLRVLAKEVTPDTEPRIAELQGMLREILELDAESGLMLQNRKDGIVEQMELMNRSAAALNKGYGDNKDGGQGRFVSRKG